MGQLLAWVRFGYGTVLLLAPEAVLGKLARCDIDRRALSFARLLGARELLQAELGRRHATRRGLLAGAGVDAIHSTSMLALAHADPPRRQLARQSAATAAAWAMAGVAAAYIRP